MGLASIRRSTHQPRIAKAAVYGHDGSEWAKSAGNSATGAEAQKLLQHMASNGTSQISYGGQSFITLRNADGQVFYGKQGAGYHCCKEWKSSCCWCLRPKLTTWSM